MVRPPVVRGLRRRGYPSLMLVALGSIIVGLVFAVVGAGTLSMGEKK